MSGSCRTGLEKVTLCTQLWTDLWTRVHDPAGACGRALGRRVGEDGGPPGSKEHGEERLGVGEWTQLTEDLARDGPEQQGPRAQSLGQRHRVDVGLGKHRVGQQWGDGLVDVTRAQAEAPGIGEGAGPAGVVDETDKQGEHR